MDGVELHPVAGPRDERAYNPVEVETARKAMSMIPPKAKRRTEGDLAAQVFELFDQGELLRDIVQKLHVKPERVRELYLQWRDDDLELYAKKEAEKNAGKK